MKFNDTDIGRLKGLATAMDANPLHSAQLSPSAVIAFAELEAHLRSGRVGSPWCRWAVRSFDVGRFFVADATQLGEPCQFRSVIAQTVHAFASISGSKAEVGPGFDCLPTRRAQAQDSLTVLLPTNVSSAAETIVQAERPSLLKHGLMIALLHPGSQLRPLTEGADGHPYRTASSFLSVRWAVPEDRVFVNVNPELSTLLESFLKRCLGQASESLGNLLTQDCVL